MAIEVTIHKINTEGKTCVVTIIDNNNIILDKKNIGLSLNPDGTADNNWINERIKTIVSEHRLTNNYTLDIDTVGS